MTKTPHPIMGVRGSVVSGCWLAGRTKNDLYRREPQQE